MKTLMTIAFLGLGYIVNGQSDHLEPHDDRSQHGGILKEYYDNIMSKLLTGVSDTPLARYLVRPSFSPEYVMSIEENSENEYIIKLQSCSESYWSAKEKDKVQLISNERKIEKELADKIKEVFELAISQTKKPEKGVIGYDGTRYSFSTYDQYKGLTTGDKWSPTKKTKMAELVNICENLTVFVTTPKLGMGIFITQIDNLILKLKN